MKNRSNRARRRHGACRSLGSANAFAAINVVTIHAGPGVASSSEVGGDKVTVESLAKGYQDPHFVEAKPSFILKLHGADLLVAVGRELEIGWLPPLINQAATPRFSQAATGYLDASLTAKILDMPTGQITRAMGDVHPAGQPAFLARSGERPPHRPGGAEEADRDRAAPTRRTSRSGMPTSIAGWPRPRSGGRRRWRRTRG